MFCGGWGKFWLLWFVIRVSGVLHGVVRDVGVEMYSVAVIKGLAAVVAVASAVAAFAAFACMAALAVGVGDLDRAVAVAEAVGRRLE